MTELSTINKCIDRQHKSVREVIDDQTEFLQLVDLSLETAGEIIGYVQSKHLEGTFVGPFFAVGLAQTIVEYMEDSFFLTCNRRLDQAAALFRMAAEATRDLRRICEEPSLEAIFLKKRERREEYQKRFRFRDDIPLEQGLRNLYKLCSEYGVHGHMLSIMLQKPYDYVAGGKGIEVRVPELAVYQRILFWLNAYRMVMPLVWRALKVHIKDLGKDADVIEEFFLSLDEPLKSSRSVLDEMAAAEQA